MSNNSVVVLGFDPGLSGGLALIKVTKHPMDGRFIYTVLSGHRLPIRDDDWGWLPVPSRGTKSKVLSTLRLQTILSKVIDPLVRGPIHHKRFITVIERQQEVFSKTGSRIARGGFLSGFNYGMLVKTVDDWAMSKGVQFFVSPSSWKKDFGVPADKGQSRALACYTFDSDEHWPRQADEGIAEAALLAAWRGKQNLTQRAKQ